MSSNEIAISVEELGKKYYLPKKNNINLVSNRITNHLKEFLPCFRKNDDYYWALKDINFQVPVGSILGILGHNGAGKSTLLKILTGVTPPTTGRARIRGNIGSLLEVGTGFHPDMTGRENVFMSGVLLGMSRSDIRSHLDEITEFAGIGKFIDMPVKRYSSGMYVRLAYAVASHLQSDILLLDEVLAVGDAGFKDKCEKNIKSLTNNDKTILYVSHNMQSVKWLCDTSIVLKHGRIQGFGKTDEMVKLYMKEVHGVSRTDNIASQPPFVYLNNHAGCFGARSAKLIKSIETLKASNTPSRCFHTGDSILFRITINAQTATDVYLTIGVCDEFGERVMTLSNTHQNNSIHALNEGETTIECDIEECHLKEGIYSILLDYGRLVAGNTISYDCVLDATQISITNNNYLARPLLPGQGYYCQKSKWEIKC